MQQLMTVKEYASMKRISENTVWRGIASGAIKVERFGRAVRVIPTPDVSGYELVDLPAYLQVSINPKPKPDEKKKPKKKKGLENE
jgi:hypothetical protein